MTEKIIGVRTGPEKDDPIEWHAAGIIGDYATLCGQDGNDSVVNQYGTVERKRGAKINCPECALMWSNFRGLKLRDSDFEDS